MKKFEDNNEYFEIEFKNLKEEKEFRNIDFELCRFTDCDFTGSMFSNLCFEECRFVNCKLDNIILNNVKFKNEIVFKDSKCIGINWENVSDLLGIRIEAESTDFSFNIFGDKNISDSKFNNCIIKDGEFSGTNLKNVEFNLTDLEGSNFNRADLEEADLTSSFNYLFDVRENNVKNMKVSRKTGINLLLQFGIRIND